MRGRCFDGSILAHGCKVVVQSWVLTGTRSFPSCKEPDRHNLREKKLRWCASSQSGVARSERGAWTMRHAAFNQDASCVASCTDRGVRIHRCDTHECCYADEGKDVRLAEMLFSTSLLAVVGGPADNKQAMKTLCVINTAKKNVIREIVLPKVVLALRMNRKRLVAVMETAVSVYELADLSSIKTVETARNVSGTCALSPNPNCCYLALPGNETHGQVVLYDLEDARFVCEFPAHKSPLSTLALNAEGNLLASASISGTVIRLHQLPSGTKTCTFRRGSYTCRILSLAFGPPGAQVSFLAALSERGTVHVFRIDPGRRSLRENPISQAAGGILASVMPSMSDIVEQTRSLATIRVPLGRSDAVCCIKAVEHVDEDEEEAHEADSARPVRTPEGSIRVLVVTFSGILYDYLVENILNPENIKCTLGKQTVLGGPLLGEGKP